MKESKPKFNLKDLLKDEYVPMQILNSKIKNLEFGQRADGLLNELSIEKKTEHTEIKNNNLNNVTHFPKKTKNIDQESPQEIFRKIKLKKISPFEAKKIFLNYVVSNHYYKTKGLKTETNNLPNNSLLVYMVV